MPFSVGDQRKGAGGSIPARWPRGVGSALVSRIATKGKVGRENFGKIRLTFARGTYKLPAGASGSRRSRLRGNGVCGLRWYGFLFSVGGAVRVAGGDRVVECV
jgi:hypothetical protein